MATYAIGDVQGCFASLVALLEKIQFDRKKDRLWFTGDLVNRGPDSLAVLRFVRELGDTAVTVLGNHDLHLLAIACGHAQQKRHDTFDEILAAHDREPLLDWLRSRPLMYREPQIGFTVVHAGLAPQWDIQEAQFLANEVETALRSKLYKEFLAHMYGNQPDTWSPELEGWERLRFITNAFTRIRFCTPTGGLDLNEKRAPTEDVATLLPWFDIDGRASVSEKIIFGHWSTLGYFRKNNVVCLDSGCLWGGNLTALQLDYPDNRATSVACPQQQQID